jgi:hypothetical protein
VNINGFGTGSTADSGVVLNGVDAHSLQQKCGGYYKQNTGTPLLLLNQGLFNPNNPSQATVAPASTAGRFGQFVYLTSPQFVNTDLAVTKYFPIWEKVRMNIQVEMLNVFNHPNFAVEASAGTNSPAATTNISTAPTSRTGISTVGAAQPNGGPRIIQFRTNLSFSGVRSNAKALHLSTDAEPFCEEEWK